MKKYLRMLSMALCLMMLAGTAFADVTISDEDYALLQKYQKLETIRQLVEDQYLWEFDEEALYEGAAQGMLAALSDQYTYYYQQSRVDEVQEEISGEYGGLGIEVSANLEDMTITVRRVFHSSPAQNAGLKPDDKILAVNGEEMTAYDLDKAVSYMRGEAGGEVTLTIYRDGETFDVVCIRAVVETETLTYKMASEKVGYIRIYYFEGNLDVQFEKAMAELRNQGMEALVLDLRDNGGGFTHLAEAVCDVFLEEDDVIFFSEDRYGRRLSSYATGDGLKIPVAVLTNEYTASSSEIVTQALLDYGIAITVGETSFGKGIMQRIYTLDYTSGLQLTTEYWKSPEGICVHDEGIAPTIEVVLAEDALDESYRLIEEKDNQLQAALEAMEEALKK